jgi:hypothetical protein
MGVVWGLVGLAAASLSFALLFGGREERIFAAAQALSAAAHIFLGWNSAADNVAGETVVDLAMLAVIVPLALKTSKVWPLVAASLSVAVLMSAAAQALVQATPTAYAIAQGGWSLLADLVVGLGAWNIWRARRRGRVPSFAPQTKTPDRG